MTRLLSRSVSLSLCVHMHTLNHSLSLSLCMCVCVRVCVSMHTLYLYLALAFALSPPPPSLSRTLSLYASTCTLGAHPIPPPTLQPPTTPPRSNPAARLTIHSAPRLLFLRLAFLFLYPLTPLSLPSLHPFPLSPFTPLEKKSGDRLKTTDTTPRVIFLPRYADLLLTQPLLLATIGLMSKADTSVMVSLVG